jgi:hypothetical protein
VRVWRMLPSRVNSCPNHSPKVENRSLLVLVDETASQNSGKRA